ncbi:DUF4097 family beta strand repeat-containing protein [Brevibacillus nitrificans]|uniref:DUF4097 family beta strand repeat-containing protein n=1 Tax=Brevibacillus nitrificans TaxID=651560 RepID=UPI002859B086|nr:DUF4097 family beta strand repeat-containing protein [Brevibacillus nitrificans]MDR7315008.1 hypothetical protein [Brevibacillus nitrificans]
MRNVAKKLFGLCLLLFIIGVAGLGWLFSKQEQFAFSLKTIDEARTIEQKVKALDLSVDTTDVLIKKSDTGSAMVRLVGETAEDDVGRIQFDSNVSPDGTLRVSVRKPMPFKPFFMGNGQLRVEIMLPEAVYDSISLETATGDIKSEAIAAKEANVTSSTGDIDIAGFTGDRLTLETDTGDMKLLNIRSALTIECSTGDVSKLVLPELAHDVAIHTDTGDIRLFAEKKPPEAKLELQTDAGDIQVDWPGLNYEQKEEHYVKASAGSGGSILSVRTSTGDIRIQ